jgi:hypothetical protein
MVQKPGTRSRSWPKSTRTIGRRRAGDSPADSLSRAVAFALALLAITLNFLQPLVHAAAMRNGGPPSLWSAWCNASAADPDQSGKNGGKSARTVDHECCLGLAHAQIAPATSQAVVVLPPVATPVVRLRTLDHSANLGIRDGPHQPRGPPVSFV